MSEWKCSSCNIPCTISRDVPEDLVPTCPCIYQVSGNGFKVARWQKVKS